MALADGIKPIHTLLIGGESYTAYTGLLALSLNIIVAVVVQLVTPAQSVRRGHMPDTSA
jgi:SSS family solute:Na+ symporter